MDKIDKKNKIGIIGHLAENTNLNDGQTVKIRMILQELKNKKLYEISTVDTYKWKEKKLRTLKNIFNLSRKNNKIVLSVARKGAIIIIPLLVINKFIFKNEICYCSIGGWLSQHIQKHKIFKSFCKKIDKIFVETKDTKERLENLGFKNVERLYNFKIFNNFEKEKNTDKVISNSFCIFSRILEKKGVEDAICVINNLNKEGYNVSLDIYGPIDNNYKEKFEKIKSNFPQYIRYCGNVAPENSIKILKKYYMLLFPTKYKTEGLPGTLIDAYCAGVPVLASNWNSANEFVIENVTGYIYKFDDIKDFEIKLKEALTNKNNVIEMKKQCLEFAKKFEPSKAIEPLINFIEE